MLAIATTETAVLPQPIASDTPSDRTELLNQFIQQSGFADHEVRPLAGDASFRRYVRVVTSQASYVVMDSPPEKEPVHDYVRICDYLSKQGYSSPRIIALDQENGFMLLEDLGDQVYTAMLDQDGKPLDEELEHTLYQRAVELLVSWHQTPSMIKQSSTLELGDYGAEAYLKELSLFTDWYLPELENSQAAFRAQEFIDIWQRVLSKLTLANCYFVHRDFHANNLVWLDRRKGTAQVGVLDFQDALWGDCSYDLISLLEDARRDVSPALANEMKDLYIKLSRQPRGLFEERYAITAAQRNLKIIGIFMRLSKRDGKPQYLSYLPRVWSHLEKDLAHPALREVKQWLDVYVPRELR